MRDGDRRATTGAQVLLQPGQGVVVEVVGRLVQQQHLGTRRQQRGQPQPGLLPTGQPADGAIAVHQPETETAQGALHPGVGVVAAARLEGGGELAVLGHHRLVAVGHRGFQAAQSLLEGAQFAQRPVDDVLHRPLRRQLLVLRDVADAAVGLDGDLTRVGSLLPGEQPQQGGLARPVLPDDAGALAHGERARHVIEDGPAVEGLADVARGDLRGHAWSPRRSRGARPPGPQIGTNASEEHRRPR